MTGRKLSLLEQTDKPFYVYYSVTNLLNSSAVELPLSLDILIRGIACT